MSLSPLLSLVVKNILEYFWDRYINQQSCQQRSKINFFKNISLKIFRVRKTLISITRIIDGSIGWLACHKAKTFREKDETIKQGWKRPMKSKTHSFTAREIKIPRQKGPKTNRNEPIKNRFKFRTVQFKMATFASRISIMIYTAAVEVDDRPNFLHKCTPQVIYLLPSIIL